MNTHVLNKPSERRHVANRLRMVFCLVALGLAALTGCADDDDATEQAPTSVSEDRCAEAAAHVDACFGTALDDCSEATVDFLLSNSCEQIAANAGNANKADGSLFCPGFLWWLCGDDVSMACPEAGDGGDYHAFSSEERIAFHMAWMQCTAYGQGDVPELTGDYWEVLTTAAGGLVTSGLKMDRAYTNSTDELDKGRVKLLHPYGTVAQVELVQGEADAECYTEYSGVFAEDKLAGLARLGWGADPRLAGFIPGMGLKLFVEEQASVNLHVIHSLEGDPDVDNFFGQYLSNILDMPSGVVGAVVKLMGLVVDEPLHLRLDHLARVSTDGAIVPENERVAPHAIVFQTTDEAIASYDTSLDFRDAFSAYPPGSVLYEVLLQAKPDGCYQTWGTLRTTSTFVASEWGDRRLYFQHATEGQGL